MEYIDYIANKVRELEEATAPEKIAGLTEVECAFIRGQCDALKYAVKYFAMEQTNEPS